MSIGWEKAAQENFDLMIAKVPVFMREIAKAKVSQKAETIVKEANRLEVTEKDMIDAFFAATPFGFHGPMKNDLLELGIDYEKYGYPK